MTSAKLTQKEHAYRHIRNKVMSGLFSAGERLYPAALASEIGTSLIPVREAIGQLQSEGLIVQKPRRGIFVKEMERADLVDLIEFRATLEPAAAAAAARRITPAEIRELDQRWHDLCRMSERFDAPSDVASDEQDTLLREWQLADLAFHLLLFRIAGNRRAIRAIEDTHTMIRMFGRRTTLTAQNLRMHKEIYETVRRQDAKAARRAMSIHIRQAGRDLLARFDHFQRHERDGGIQTDEFLDSMRRNLQKENRRD
jgi:DNA-binding GntR family transcriptional regulator